MTALLILGIDTSGHTASAALLRDGALLAQTTLYTLRTHSQVMLPLTKQLLENAEVTLGDIDLFAVANGPGSYTGLRIGIAAIKAMAFAKDTPCVGISTLEGLAYHLLGTRGVLCCAMHARQDLHYCAVFSSDGRTLSRELPDSILPQDVLLTQLADYDAPITVIGDAAPLLCAESDNLIPAPPHLCLQSAAGICLAAEHHPVQTAAELAAQYLQPTKAEKLQRAPKAEG